MKDDGLRVDFTSLTIVVEYFLTMIMSGYVLNHNGWWKIASCSLFPFIFACFFTIQIWCNFIIKLQ